MPMRAPMFRRLPDRAEPSARDAHDERRGSARSRGYGRQWEVQAAVYRAEHPLCVGCEAVGRVVACELVDHVVPHDGDYDRFWDQANWQAACRWHHDRIKQTLERRYRAGDLPAEAMRLDGPEAVRLTRRLDPV
jgi:5-methylcytosine-specific restriction protein A